MITRQDLQLLVDAAELADFNVNIDDLQLIQWDAGHQTHRPIRLPRDFAAVYVFKWNDTYLKIGMVNTNSNARYQTHHYNSSSSNSNLSKSIQNDPEFQALLADADIGDWIKENTTRFNILIPIELGKKFVQFTEAFFILKCNPMFEG